VGGAAEPATEHGGDGGRSWHAAAATLVGAGYTAALAAASWSGAMDGDDDSTAIVLAVVTVIAWIAATVLLGYLLPRLAFVLIALAVIVPAFVGEQMEEFDNELRYFNWLLMLVLNAAFAAAGAWLARRR
jgi:hypothetical protein